MASSTTGGSSNTRMRTATTRPWRWSRSMPSSGPRCHGGAVPPPRRPPVARLPRQQPRSQRAARPDDRAARAPCAQALRRVRRWETRTGLHVDRVGRRRAACARRASPQPSRPSDSTPSARCILSRGPSARARPRARGLGAGHVRGTHGGHPAGAVGPLARRARIARVHGPSIGLDGHHQALAGGLDLLEQAAAAVNSLGDVEWTSLEALARANVATRLDGELATVRPYAGRVRVQLPGRACRLVVTAPRYSDGSLAGWSPGADIAFRRGSRLCWRDRGGDPLASAR